MSLENVKTVLLFNFGSRGPRECSALDVQAVLKGAHRYMTVYPIKTERHLGSIKTHNMDYISYFDSVNRTKIK